MCADSATSVSKGCFVYTGKRKRACETDYVPSSNRFVKSSYKLFKKTWDQLEIQISVLKSDLNCQIFNNLVTFLRACHKGNDKNRRLSEEIPTAVLLTGVNTPDHRLMFSSLEGLLKDSVTPYVVSLLAKDCSRVASLISTVVTHLTNLEEEDQDESSDEIHNNANLPFKLKLIPQGTSAVSMMTLVEWYKNNVFNCKMQNESNSDGITLASGQHSSFQMLDSTPLIVIMFEDVENVPAKVIQDFISICSSYLSQLPIVFVMGVATSISALHQLLPSSVSSLLCIEKFQAPPASQYLTHLMDKIIMTQDVPFKLGPKVFHFLLDIFLYHNFSIMNFTFGFQYCMMEHFLKKAISFLCVEFDEIDKVVHGLSHGQLLFVRQQPAFIRFVEDMLDADSRERLKDDAHVRNVLVKGLKSFHTYHLEMFAMMRFLHSLTSGLPKQPLGKQLREIYSLCLKENITETGDFVHAFQLLKMMSRQDLTELLTNSLPVLENAKGENENLNTIHFEMNLLTQRLIHLDEKKEEQVDANDDNTASGNIRLLPKRAKLYELKQQLLSMPSHRKLSPYERLRNEIIEVIRDYCENFLICPLNKPLHEIFYFNDIALIKDYFRAVPRNSIQRALTQPNKYLNCVCCECDVDEILPSMPDICIVYKLHLECGTLVNLFDWMQAFITIVSQDDQSAKKKKRQAKKPECHLRARFIRAVSELQFLGFIKSTNRKTDHVARLTW